MLKIDSEKFDKLIDTEIFINKECMLLISQIKQFTGRDDELVNSLIIKIFEIAYQQGFKYGMNFIIKREKIDIFY